MEHMNGEGLLKRVGNKWKTTHKGLEYIKTFENLLTFIDEKTKVREVKGAPP